MALERSELLSLPKNSGKFQTQLYKSMDQWRIVEKDLKLSHYKQLSNFLFLIYKAVNKGSGSGC